jgi:drug/metabolite transporter (DMT)-like permease
VSRRGFVLFAAMCVIWGIPYLLIKVAVDSLEPAALVFLRTGVGALILVPLAAVRGDLAPLLKRWRVLLVYTVVEVAVPWFRLADAERHLSSSLSGLLVAAVPLIGAVLSRLSGGEERFSVQRIAGLLVGLGGVAALLGLDVSGGDLGAVAEIGLVTVGYATGPLLISRQLRDLPATGVVAASLGLTAVAYAPYALTHMPASAPSTRVITAVAILAIVCTALAFLLFFALIAEVGPVRATVITYVNPAVAVALGVAILGESFTVGTAIGFVLILLGSFLATRRAGPAPAARAPAAQADNVLAVEMRDVTAEPVASP